MHEGYLSLKDAHDEESKFANQLKNINKDVKSVENVTLFLLQVLNNFKRRLFSTKNQN